MRKNNKFIVIISIILLLAVAGGVFAYLFFATDLFKSNRDLFRKYFVQELETFEKIAQIETIEEYQNLTNETKYQSNTDIKVIHSEGGEVSNPLNNLSMKLDFQKDDEQQYFYGNGKLSYENEGYFETEIIKDQEQYGIRFPKVFKQFVTINEDDDIEVLADEIEIDVQILETIIKIMNGNEEIVSKEEIDESKNKYLNIISTEISNGIFEKQKNAMITYNNVTTKTNAYSVSLTSDQVRTILSEISEDLTSETEVPSAKITVYVQKEQTIRTVIEIGENKIIIENAENAGEIKTKINYINLSDEESIECNIIATKNNTETEENFEIIANILKGEETQEVTFLSKMQLSNEEKQLDLEISYKQDITTISLMAENIVKIGSDFEKTQMLSENNFKSLSSISNEEKRIQIINSLKQMVTQQTSEEIGLLMQKLMLNIEDSNVQNENQEQVEEISQAEINNFNAKFEFYTGEEVSTENVKVLLDIVKGNCSGHSIVNIAPNEDDEEVIETKSEITLYIEEGATNEESITKVLEQINDNKKYKVLISYKETNGLIDYITMTEI